MLLIALRGASLAFNLAAFGELVFVWLILREPSLKLRLLPRLRRLILLSLLAACMLTLAWLLMQTAVMSDADTLADTFAALPIVAGDTRFGQAMLIRLGLLVAAIILVARRRWPSGALLCSGPSVLLQTSIAHAAARLSTDGPVLLVSESIHLLAAAAWLGGLIPLWICVAGLPSEAGARLARAFSPLGLACVLLVAGTGLLQAADLVGTPAHLTGSEYGRIALMKLLIFAVLLSLAGANRFVFLGQRRRLMTSLIVEALLGGGVILLAGWLASSAPPVH